MHGHGGGSWSHCSQMIQCKYSAQGLWWFHIEPHKRKPGLWCRADSNLGDLERLSIFLIDLWSSRKTVPGLGLSDKEQRPGWHLVVPFLVSCPLLSEAGAVSWLSSQRGLCMTDYQLQQEQALLTALPPPPPPPPKCISSKDHHFFQKAAAAGQGEPLLPWLPALRGDWQAPASATTCGSLSRWWSLETNSPLFYYLR